MQCTYLMIVLLCVGTCKAKFRANVIVTGTTMQPNFKRLEGKISLVCPEEYPWAFSNGTKCCLTFQKTTMGSLQFEDSECLANWIKCPATLPQKCVSLEKPIICPKTSPIGLGLGCCASDYAVFDPADEECSGQKLEPYVSPLRCCAQFVDNPICKNMTQTCKTNYEGIPLTRPSKTIVKEGSNWDLPNHSAQNVFEDELCQTLRKNYWLPRVDPHDPTISGYFIMDLGLHMPFRQFKVRNEYHIGNSGTKEIEIKISNYSDSAWVSVVNATLDDPLGLGPCDVPLLVFKIPQAIICRFVYFIVHAHYRVAAAIRYVGVE